MLRRGLFTLALLLAAASTAVAQGKFYGNFATGATVVMEFNTFDNTGAGATLGGTPVVSIYKDNGTTEVTTGVTLTASFDSRTGYNLVVIDTSSDGTFYAAGHEFHAVITTGTVSSISVVGTGIGSFSLQNRVATADVTKWNGSSVATPDTAGYPKVTIKDGTGTGEIDTASGQVIASSVQGNVTGTINGLTATALADFFDTNSGTTYASAVAGSVVKEIADNAGGGTPPTPAAIADAVWDEAQSGHTSAGTFGKFLDVEVSAVKAKTDSLTFTVGNQVDANVLDWKSATAPAMTGDAFARLGSPAGASVSADISAVKTDTAAIKLKTDSLTFTVANKIDANVYTWNGTAVATPDTAGYPKVTIKDGTGTGEIDTASGQVIVATNNDKTGYRLSATGVDDVWDEVQSGHTTSGTFGKYLDQQVSTITGGATAAQVWDYATSSISTFGSIGKLVKDALTWPTGAVQTDAGNSATKFKTDRTEGSNDWFINADVVFNGACNVADERRRIMSYNASTKVITVSPSLTAKPDDGCTFQILTR